MSRYDIGRLKKMELDFAAEARNHFTSFFREFDYSKSSTQVSLHKVKSAVDVDKIPYGAGVYIILTDYEQSNNECRFQIDGLRAIYRGHCHSIKKRIMSHLFNTEYKATLTPTGVRYDVCLKLDECNGLNIHEAPYSKARWCVVAHKMPQSSKLIREQAEVAFDDVYGRPIASREVRPPIRA